MYIGHSSLAVAICIYLEMLNITVKVLRGELGLTLSFMGAVWSVSHRCFRWVLSEETCMQKSLLFVLLLSVLGIEKHMLVQIRLQAKI